MARSYNQTLKKFLFSIKENYSFLSVWTINELLQSSNFSGKVNRTFVMSQLYDREFLIHIVTLLTNKSVFESLPMLYAMEFYHLIDLTSDVQKESVVSSQDIINHNILSKTIPNGTYNKDLRLSLQLSKELKWFVNELNQFTMKDVFDKTIAETQNKDDKVILKQWKEIVLLDEKDNISYTMKTQESVN